MVVREPQFAVEYENRTTAAVKSVLVEIVQILGSFEGKFAVIGGAVPWLLLNEADMPHSGTIDVDLGLDPSALGDGEYVRLVEALQKHGYHQRDDRRPFQLVRTVPARDGGPDIEIDVDFLMPSQSARNPRTPATSTIPFGITRMESTRSSKTPGHSLMFSRVFKATA